MLLLLLVEMDVASPHLVEKIRVKLVTTGQLRLDCLQSIGNFDLFNVILVQVNLEGYLRPLFVDEHVGVVALFDAHPFVVVPFVLGFYVHHASEAVAFHVLLKVEVFHPRVIELIPALLSRVNKILISLPVHINIRDVVTGLCPTHMNQDSHQLVLEFLLIDRLLLHLLLDF